jgi:hypothetical protein
MKSDYLVAALLAGAVAIGLGAISVHSSSTYCPNPSAASVAALFAPCQAFDTRHGPPGFQTGGGRANGLVDA